jgi:hypothetical protein
MVCAVVADYCCALVRTHICWSHVPWNAAQHPSCVTSLTFRSSSRVIPCPLVLPQSQTAGPTTADVVQPELGGRAQRPEVASRPRALHARLGRCVCAAVRVGSPRWAEQARWHNRGDTRTRPAPPVMANFSRSLPFLGGGNPVDLCPVFCLARVAMRTNTVSTT